MYYPTLFALILLGVQAPAANRIFCQEDRGKPIYFISADRRTAYTFFQGKRSQPISVTKVSSRSVRGTVEGGFSGNLMTETSYILADSTVLITLIPANSPGADGIGKLKNEIDGRILKNFFLCGNTAD